jgi:hypothetical protein
MCGSTNRPMRASHDRGLLESPARKPMRDRMTRVSKISAIGCVLAVLMPFYAGSTRAARVVVKPPPPPRVVVRLPAVRPQQQLSFWGVETTLQQSRDDSQPTAPRHHRRHAGLPKLKSAHQMQ